MAHQFWISYHPPTAGKHTASGDETPPIPEEELEQQKIEHERQMQKEKECQAREAEEVRKLDLELLHQRAIEAEEEQKREIAEAVKELRGMNTSWSHHQLCDLQRKAARLRHSRPSVPDTTKHYRQNALKKACSAQLAKPYSSQSIGDGDGIFINLSRLRSGKDESTSEVLIGDRPEKISWRASANDVKGTPHEPGDLVRAPSCPGSSMRRTEMHMKGVEVSGGGGGGGGRREGSQISRSESTISRCTPHTPHTPHSPLGPPDSVSVDSNPMSTIYRCRAPIASLDCMDDFSANSQQMLDQVGDLTVSRHMSTYLGNHTSMPPSAIAPGLRFKTLGKSGLRVPNVGLGIWSILNEDNAEDMVMTALDNGINLFDLSEAHCGKTNNKNKEQVYISKDGICTLTSFSAKAEAELGRILKKRNVRRTSIIVTTKIYWSTKSDERGLSRKHIIESIKASLARLQLDYIDVVLLHKLDPVCPMEELVRAMTYVINQGWVMYWGTARWTPSEIMDAYSNCRQFNCITPIVEQTEYHMFCREKAELYMPELYHKVGVGMMVWSALTTGKILGEEEVKSLFAKSKFNRKYSTFSWCDEEKEGNEIKPADSKEKLAEDTRTYNDKLRDLTKIASILNCTMSQLAIAWCLKNDSIHCLLLGATSVQQLKDNIHALQVVPQLTPTMMTDIENVLANKPTRPPMVSTLAMRNQTKEANNATIRLDMTEEPAPEGEEQTVDTKIEINQPGPSSWTPLAVFYKKQPPSGVVTSTVGTPKVDGVEAEGEGSTPGKDSERGFCEIQ